MSDAAYRLCPHCRAGNAAKATMCWMCHSMLAPIDATSARQVAEPAAPAAAPTSEPAWPGPTRNAWMVTLLVSVILSLAIAAELARVAPGVLVLFLFVDLPVIGAMLVTVAKIWGGEAPSSDASTARGFAVRAAKGVAIGVGGLFALLALLFLVAGALFIIAFAICMAMLATGHV